MNNLSFPESCKITEKLIPFSIATADSHALEIFRISQDIHEAVGAGRWGGLKCTWWEHDKGKEGPLKAELEC